MKRPFSLSRLIVKRAGLLVALGICSGQQTIPAMEGRWVATWGCGTQLVEPANLPPEPLSNSTLRQFVHVTIGGKHLQMSFSNAYGTSPVTMNSIHVALSAEAASLGDGHINPATDKPLTFHGAPSITIPPGAVVSSDPFDYDLPALADLAVTICFGAISSNTITGHPGSRTTSFLQPGNAVAAESMPGSARTTHWYLIAGIDVWTGNSEQAIAVLGDSITDGRGSTTDGNDRWPDNLARRLNTNAPTAGVGVINMGIGGNALFGGLGPAAVNRFDRDVLNQSGVRWVIIFEGVNDLGGGATETTITNALAQFVAKAHARNLLAYGATITPFGGNSYYTPAHEAARQAVNNWIRTSGKYDAVIDFDARVRNPATVTNLLSTYDSGDGLHLNPTGYQTMASAIDLNWFTH